MRFDPHWMKGKWTSEESRIYFLMKESKFGIACQFEGYVVNLWLLIRKNVFFRLGKL